LTLFLEGIVLSVSDDDVVQKVDVQQFAGPLDASGQILVGMTGRQVARGMVVANGEDGAVGKDGFLHDNTHIDRRFRDAAMRDAPS